jgi:hypothetical protein
MRVTAGGSTLDPYGEIRTTLRSPNVSDTPKTPALQATTSTATPLPIFQHAQNVLGQGRYLKHLTVDGITLHPVRI